MGNAKFIGGFQEIREGNGDEADRGRIRPQAVRAGPPARLEKADSLRETASRGLSAGGR